MTTDQPSTGARKRGTERTSRTSSPPDPSNISSILIQNENQVKVATRIKVRSES
ncbi:hypothetical protein GX48_02470 [Paracoccidioides brasiliensis]|nr:hypothetical protein GX48_02470 [Paracoccidioides brasiliensis]